MKSLLCLLALLLAVNFSYAQNTSWPSPTSSDKVGIGTTSPIEKTTVANTDPNALGIYRNLDVTSVGPAGIFLNFGARNGNTFTPGAQISGILFNPATNGELDFSTLTSGSMTTKMIINSAGNVGIGTTSPNGKLDVNGAILLQGATSNTMSRPAVTATRISGEITSYSTGGANYDDGLLRLSAGGGTNAIVKTFIDLSGYSTIPDMNRNIVLGTAGTERMRIDASGNVGIGTTTPDTKFAVNGTIHSKEVKVDLLGWPDYVFKPTYQLPKLSEVKSYIDLNQHLPDMPSEAEVKKDGINLGEMVKLQTKKIEELTLYLIEKDKEKKEQDVKIDQLKQMVETLTKEIRKKD